jgi:hypothetical protein
VGEFTPRAEEIVSVLNDIVFDPDPLATLELLCVPVL